MKYLACEIGEPTIILVVGIRAGIAYNFYVVPYSIPAIKKLDKKFIALHKTICRLPKNTPNIATQLSHDLFGIEAFSLQTPTYVVSENNYKTPSMTKANSVKFIMA